jgi:microcompartment protein CcmK/EutM
MRIVQVVGTVTLNRCHPSFVGARLKLVIPLTLDDLAGRTEPEGESLVLWDQWGAGIGDKVAMSEGPEASMPFRPEIKPVDAYNTAILDHIELRMES